MSGFTSGDNLISKVSASKQRWHATGCKQANPTAAAVANEWHTLFRGGGYPQADAIFDAGVALQFQSVCDLTPNAGCIYHGGNITGADYKTLMAAMANTAAATCVPGSLCLVDLLGFYRVTAVTTTSAQSTINGSTFTADNDSGNLRLTYATYDWNSYSKVRFTTTGTLPTGLSLATDYWLVRQSSTTSYVATSFANAIAGTYVAYTDGGSGTHTLTCQLPRYSDGAGVQAIFFNPQSTALGAGTPGLSLGYTNSAGTGSRATPTSPSLPIGKTAASNSHILYSGATAAGKMGPFMPLQGADAGIRSIETIRNNSTYTSGMYSVALVVELCRIPLTVLGQDTHIDLTTMFPSFPPVYDGAALYWLWKSGVATPANSAFDFDLIFGWNS